MSDKGVGFFIGAALAVAAFIFAVTALGAWVITIGWNDLQLYEFFHAQQIDFGQAFGGLLVTAILGQFFRAGPR